jgi:hypothetical protein
MGSGERQNRVLTKESRDKDMSHRVLVDSLVGPVLRHNIHSRGCPKCNADAKGLKKQWCPGNLPSRADDNVCFVDGQHLHARCEVPLGGCGFEWREECRDADDVPGSARVL